MGRKRITMSKIENKPRRQTTFTKRRTGLFKKVNELCELCNAEAMRKRITMSKIENKPRRQTTFTKRRTGLFKKVNELCELCNAEAIVITLSEVGNVFASGSPNVDAVINRYLARNPNDDAHQEETSKKEEDGGRGEEVKRLKEKLRDTLARLEVEKQKGEYLKKALELTAAGAPADPAEEAIAAAELAQFQDKWRKEIMKKDGF